jgi:hypothetical protein
VGLRVRDIGDVLSWPEFRAFIEHLEPSPRSAFFRAQYPKSYWWTPDIEFLAAIAGSLQSANWQRGGGKGPRPKPMKRPKETRKKISKSVDPKTGNELVAKRQALRDEITRRRLLHDNERRVADGD